MPDQTSERWGVGEPSGPQQIPFRRRVEPYRVGNHNSRNIYRAGQDRDSDEHVAVAFTPGMGRLIVIALNALGGDPGVRDDA